MKKRPLQITACLLAMTLLTGCGARTAPAEPTTISQATLLEKSAQPLLSLIHISEPTRPY